MFDSLNLSRLEALRPILPLPLWQKAAALGAVFVLLMAGYVYFGWTPVQDEIARVERDLEQQKRILARNLRLAKDLPRKKKEYAKLKKQLRVALNMLPKKSQIPDLLEGVTRAGKNAGLEFTVFQPLPEVRKQFYAEVPVNLAVTGTYRQLVSFLKRVGEMPRIVDVKNLSLGQARAGGRLTVKGQAVTYRFVEPGKKKTKHRKHGR